MGAAVEHESVVDERLREPADSRLALDDDDGHARLEQQVCADEPGDPAPTTTTGFCAPDSRDGTAFISGVVAPGLSISPVQRANIAAMSTIDGKASHGAGISVDGSFFAEHRSRLLKALGRDAAILFASPHRLRNADTEYRYRQSSDVYYLSGWEDPEAVLLLRPVPRNRSCCSCSRRPRARGVDRAAAGPEGAPRRSAPTRRSRSRPSRRSSPASRRASRRSTTGSRTTPTTTHC